MKENLHLVVQDICQRIKVTSSIDLISIESNQNQLENLLTEATAQLNEDLRLRVRGEFVGHGPLGPLLDDEEITEIIINSWKDIWFEKGGQFYESKDSFLSQTTFHSYIQRLCRDLKTQITFDQPFICETKENLRVHIVAPSVSGRDYNLSIRKHRQRRLTYYDLLSSNSISQSQLDFIRKAIEERKNFLVVGPTGSGKTTFLNCCLTMIESSERIVIIEDTSELSIPNGLSSKLLTRKDSQGLLSPIDLTDLIKESLRMRPDRLVLGEVRGPEAKDLLLALSTGHEGSIGTLHAVSAQEALIRLEMLIQLGAPQWSLDAIRRLIYFSLNYIVCLERNKSGHRSVKGIHKLAGLESFGFLLEKAH